MTAGNAAAAAKAITELSQRELNNMLDILCVNHPDELLAAIEQVRARNARRTERAVSAGRN